MGQYVGFDSSSMTADALIDALVVENTGITVDMDSVVYQYGMAESYNSEVDPFPSISFYTASPEDNLSIGDGLLLSSGTANPNQTNTTSSFSSYFTDTSVTYTDPDLEVTAKEAFSGSGDIHDATVLEFSFEINDLYVHGIKFDLVFGSDEYPEYSDSSYVDIAGVYLNGENIALFNGDATQPLSVVSQNLEVGNFIDNSDNHIPIEYDGISNKLTIYAPVQPGVNTIKIAIADTGDSYYDSGLYVANLEGTQLTGSGLSAVTTGTDADDNMVGTDNSETFDTGDGDDYIDPQGGDDIILAGAGDDVIIGGNGDNQIDGGTGVDEVVYNESYKSTYIKIMDNNTIHVGENSDNLLNVEKIKFDDMTFDTHDMFIEDDVAKVYIAYFGRAADPAGLEYWLDQANTQLANGKSYSSVIFDIVSAFSDSAEAEAIYPGINEGNMDEAQMSEFISSIYQNLFNRDADKAGLDYWIDDGMKLQESGVNIGTIVKTIIDGAQDTAEYLDRTFMQNKAQVAWDYAKQYELAGETWDSATDTAEAKSVLVGITSDTSSVNAEYDHILTFF